VDERRVAVTGIRLDALPHVEHRSARRVHEHAPDRAQRLEAAIVTPKAGRITTSSARTPEKSNTPSEFGSRISIPIPRSLALTCGLWMISPTSSSRRSGNLRRV
jgi:hypothetical protein